jgi:hypothetical protein
LFLIESFFLKPMSGFVISVNNEKWCQTIGSLIHFGYYTSA